MDNWSKSVVITPASDLLNQTKIEILDFLNHCIKEAKNAGKTIAKIEFTDCHYNVVEEVAGVFTQYDYDVLVHQTTDGKEFTSKTCVQIQWA